jgi:hypothetical protein
MGFSWNGVHTGDVGIRAELVMKPVLPEPKIIIEELPHGEGFYDFSVFNNNGKVNYKPREWEFKCGYEGHFNQLVSAVKVMFASYSGILVSDDFPGLKWRGIITNKLDVTQTALIFGTFPVYIKTQPFPEN